MRTCIPALEKDAEIMAFIYDGREMPDPGRRELTDCPAAFPLEVKHE